MTVDQHSFQQRCTPLYNFECARRYILRTSRKFLHSRRLCFFCVSGTKRPRTDKCSNSKPDTQYLLYNYALAHTIIEICLRASIPGRTFRRRPYQPSPVYAIVKQRVPSKVQNKNRDGRGRKPYWFDAYDVDFSLLLIVTCWLFYRNQIKSQASSLDSYQASYTQFLYTPNTKKKATETRVLVAFFLPIPTFGDYCSSLRLLPRLDQPTLGAYSQKSHASVYRTFQLDT